MKKTLLTLFLMASMAVASQAQIVQTMTLKNGSVLYGYTKSQKPGSNSVFTSEKAVIVMDGKTVKEIIPHKAAYKNLSEEWKKWAEENEVLYGLGDSREMTLSTIVDNTGHRISDVYILEKGQSVKYVEFSKHEYPVDWADILCIEYNKRPNTLLSGINRSLTVKANGVTKTASGQCLKEIPGQTTYLLEDDGVAELFDMKDIIKDNSIKNNPNQSLFEQSALLDEIVMKNGTVYKGIVTERNYVDNSNYFLITSKNGDVEYTTSLKMEDVAEYRKQPNPEYEPVYDILLKEGDMVVNRKEITLTEIPEVEDVFEILVDTTKTTLKMEGKSLALDVEANFKKDKEAQDWMLIKTRKVEKTKKKAEHHVFNYADMVKNSLSPVEVVTSMNNTTKFAYDIKEKGLYVFFNKSTKKAVLIEVD